MANIILATQGTGGDLHPFIEMACALRARGHKATLLTNERFEPEVLRYGLTFLPLEYISEGDLDGVGVEEDGAHQPLPASSGVNPFILDYCTNIFNKIRDLAASEKTVLVAHFNLVLLTQTIAEKLGLPYITVFTAPYFVFTIHALEETLISQANLLNQYRQTIDLPAVDDWGLWLRATRWNIGLWPEWFARVDSSWPIDVTPVGFMCNRNFETGQIPEEMKDLIGAGAPLVLITHGTSRPYRPEFFSSAIAACKRLNLMAVVVTPYGHLISDNQSQGISKYKYLPFATVLPYTEAVIHHGGIGTVNQAMVAGIPQLVLGYRFDRSDNGNRVKRLGIGEFLPSYRWTDSDVVESCRRILSSEVKERCRRVSLSHAQGADPAAAACDVINLSLG
jgi:rhamnosyltransferase subunit B